MGTKDTGAPAGAAHIVHGLPALTYMVTDVVPVKELPMKELPMKELPMKELPMKELPTIAAARRLRARRTAISACAHYTPGFRECGNDKGHYQYRAVEREGADRRRWGGGHLLPIMGTYRNTEQYEG